MLSSHLQFSPVTESVGRGWGTLMVLGLGNATPEYNSNLEKLSILFL